MAVKMRGVLKNRTERRFATGLARFSHHGWVVQATRLCHLFSGEEFSLEAMNALKPVANRRSVFRGALPRFSKLNILRAMERLLKLFLVVIAFGAASANAANFTVKMTGFQFSPKDLTVSVGDTVTWVNQDSTFHDTTSGVGRVPSGVWKSPLLGNGSTFSFTFNVVPGTYPYYCTPHVFAFNMVGSVTVLPPNTPPLVNITNPKGGATFTAGANVQIEADASDNDGVARVEFFADGKLIGTDFSAPFSASLNNVAVGNYSLTAKAFDTQGLSATSVAVNISVNEARTGPSIISHPQSQSVLPGKSVTFSVSASGTPPLSYQWRFNGTNISGATASSLTLSNVQTNDAGNYAVLVSNNDGSTLSATAILTVTAAPNIPPLVSINAPTNGARFREGSIISFQAEASDADGEIAQVEFLLNSNSVAVLTNAPYEIALSNVTSGEYFLTARATDNASGSTTSDAVNFSVLTPPVIEFGSPTNGARFPFGATIRLEAQVSVVAGLDVTQFQFFEIVSNDLRAISPAFAPGGIPIPDENVSAAIPPLPLGFLFDWTSAELGAHTLVGIAIDELGGTNQSEPVDIEVFEPSVENPTIAITNSPKNFSRLTNSPILINGIAGDDFRVERVEFQVNGGPFLQATGTTNWFAQVDLAAGTNVINFRSADFAGNFSTNDIRQFTYVVKNPLSLQVLGLGVVRPNLDGKLLEIGKIYQMIARSGRGQIFGGWNGAAISNKAVLNFEMKSHLVLTANFVPNPFAPLKGTYTGLIFETNNVRATNSGFIKLKVTSRGKFSGKLTLDGRNLRLHGALDYLGNAEIPLLRRPISPVLVTLNLDLSGANGISGEVTDGNWVSVLAAKKALERAVIAPRLRTGNRSITFDVIGELLSPDAVIEARKLRSSGAVSFRFTDSTTKKNSPTAFWAANNSAPFFFWFDHSRPPVLGNAHLNSEPAQTK